MTKPKNIKKQNLKDYVYKCGKCHITAHEPEPSNTPCPICNKRMELKSWPTPDPIKYPEEHRTETQERVLKLST